MKDRTIRLFPEDGGGSFGLMPVTAGKPGRTVELLDGKNAVSRPPEGGRRPFSKQNVVIGRDLAELKPSPGSETTAAFQKSVSEVRYWSGRWSPVRGCMTSPFGVNI
jgi:hypothetical protein